MSAGNHARLSDTIELLMPSFLTAWYTVGPRGRRVTARLPGTGLFWTERLPPPKASHARRGWTFVVIWGAIAALMIAHFAGFVP
jgi:hypothetical protein